MNNDVKTTTHQKQDHGYAVVITVLCMGVLLITQFSTIRLSLTLPFMEFSGFHEGQFIGLKNFSLLPQFFLFQKSWLNSITYSLVAYGFAAIFGGIFATALANTNSKKAVSFFSILIQLILVLPVLCLAYFLSLNPEWRDFSSQATFILFLKAVPLGFLVSYIAIKNGQSSTFGMGCFLLLALPFWINTNFDYGFMNPHLSNLGQAGEITTLLIQTAFYQFLLGYASAMYFVISLWRIIAVSIAIPVLKALLKDKEIHLKRTPLMIKNGILSGVFLLVGVLIFGALVIFQRREGVAISKILYYMLLFGVQTILFCLATLLLAYPLVFGSGLYKKIYGVVLAVCFVFGNNIVSDYMNIRNLGLINTALPLVFAHVIQIPMVVILAFYANHQPHNEADGRKSYGSRVARPLVALAVLNFCNRWGTGMDAIIYISSPSQFAPMQTLYVAQRETNMESLIPMAIQLMIVPVIVFLVFRNFFVTELEDRA